MELSKYRFWNQRISFVLLLTMCSVVLPLKEAIGIEISDILRAWEDRQEATKSVIIRWESIQVITPSGENIPEEDRNLVELPPREATLFIEGDKLRLENATYNNDEDPSRSGVSPRTATFDGATEMRFIEKTGSWRHNVGFVRPNVNSTSTIENAHLAPLLLYYRPLLPDVLGMRRCGPYTLAGIEMVGNLECYRIRRSAESKIISEEFWVATKSYVPIRYSQTVRSVKSMLADIEYKMPDDGEPMLSKWTVTLLKNEAGDVLESSRGKVIEIVANQDIDDSKFRIDFPANTRVTELGETEKDFLVDDDKQWIPYGEYELTAAPSRFRSMLLAITLIVVIGLAILVARKHFVKWKEM